MNTTHPLPFALAIHGGAGTITRAALTAAQETFYLKGLRQALERGAAALQNNCSALDAVEISVRALEDNPLFNAGRGSVFTENEKHEMDACIMSGLDLRAGGVACVSNIKNPVTLARKVLEQTEHVLLCAEGAHRFAVESGCEFAPDEYFFDALRYQQLLAAKRACSVQLDHHLSAKNLNAKEKQPAAAKSTELKPAAENPFAKKFGTVGAVALDAQGNLAAATSTGGMTNKRCGRIGDTPIVGLGTYANNSTCAVSCTGHGEHFMRHVAAYDVSCLMKYQGLSLQQACQTVINHKLKAAGGEGGLIAADAQGNLALVFNSEGMYRACITHLTAARISIYKD